MALNRSTLNPEAEKKLKEILEKDINALTDPDREFLFARRDYLSKEERETYKHDLRKIQKINEAKVAREAEEAGSQPKEDDKFVGQEDPTEDPKKPEDDSDDDDEEDTEG